LVDEAKDKMVDNIDITLARGDKLAALQTKTQEMQQQAGDFRDNADTWKSNICKRNAHVTIMVIIAIIVLIVIIVMIACNPSLSKC